MTPAMQAAVQAIVDQAPPLTPSQVARLRALLAPAQPAPARTEAAA